MAIALANKLGVAATNAAGLSSWSLTVTNTTTALNRIIVAVKWGAADRAATISDSKGNTYTLDSHVGTALSIYSARGDNVLTASVDTITINWTGGTVNQPGMAAYEFSGLTHLGALDQNSSASGNSNSPNSGNVTTTQANELIFGLLWDGSNSNFNAHSDTMLDNFQTSSDWILTQYKIVSSTGTYASSGTIPGSFAWLANVATYSDTTTSRFGVVNSVAPIITGSGVVGMQLTCSQGVWTNNPTAYSYQWKRDGSNIATGAHYLVTTTDVGHVLSCVVTASSKYGSVAATASNTVTPSVNNVKTGLGI